LLIEQAPTASLLMVLTARPEFVPPWPARSHITPITLNRLERPHTEALVARIAGAKLLPEEVVDHIVTKTDGVPLYVEELTKTILASDILRDSGKSYELTGPLSSLSIPDTLQESLMARLDRLPQVRELAQLGSVLGREFAYEMISGLSTIGDTVLQEGLRQLVDAELLYQRGRPPRAKYIFKHALVKDAAYGSLLRRPRQQYHRQVAELLEKSFPETVEANPDLLAHHYSEAGVVDRAVDYWQLAGQRAIERSANTEAIAHLKFGVSMIRAVPASDALALRELKLQTMLAGPLIATEGYSAPETVAVFERAHELSNQVNDPTLMFPVLYQQWVFNLINHTGARIPETLRISRQFLEMAEAQQDTLPKVLGHRITATSQYALGDFTQARTGLETAISYYDEEQHGHSTFEFGQNPKSASLAFLGITLHILGYPDQAKKIENAALDHAEEIEHAYTIGYVRCFGDFCAAFFRRDIYDAERSNASVLKLADEQNFPLFNWFAEINAGWILSKQGCHDEAIVTAQSGLENLRKAGIFFLLPMVMGQVAEVLAAGGQADKALDLLGTALDTVGRSEERFFEAELYRLKGEQLILANRPGAAEEAEKLFVQSLDVARNQQARSWELRTATSLARMWGQQGKADDACDLLQPIYNWFTEGFDTADLKDAKALLDELA
jgi:predicted ATPase